MPTVVAAPQLCREQIIEALEKDGCASGPQDKDLQVFDGAGRAIAAAKNHPGSFGGFSGRLTVYDVMGRAVKQSNPTETSINIPQTPALLNPYAWLASGDDSTWHYTQQTYNWNGQPLRTTHPDATYREAEYSGCGCAGGEVVTLTDEGTIDGGVAKRRQQKIYSDVLGRAFKVELLNWQGGTPYSTTVTSYNVRDQVTQILQYAGAEGTGTPQQTVMGYDGNGRLSTKHIPEQNAGTATLYTYNPDDTVLSITDGRGASVTHSYNNRHLLTGISYSAPAGITPAPNATFGYDGAGNRTSMTDGLGSKSYNYDQLSRLMSETRVFTGVGTFALSYDYNLANHLKKITDASNTTINYSYDVAGQLTGVTGSDTLVAGVSTYASGFQYRAWGGVKQVSVATLSSSFGYNSRLQTTNFNISGVVNENYDYYNDGRLSFVHNTTDPNFDREIRYDHVGRLTLAGAGGEARHDTGPVPFLEVINYNAFNNTTLRETETWGNGYYFDSASYTNQRRTGWGYDAAGRITTIDTRTYAYDSAGRNITLTGQRWTPSGYVPTMIESGFDGDGDRVRENSDSSGSTILTYYLRSTVLGEIVEELNGSGQKQIGYVYTPSGTQIATQVVGQNYVLLKQMSPVGTTQRGVFTTGSTSRIEFDPVGAIVRTNSNGPFNPSGNTGDLPSGGGGSMDSRFSSLSNPAAGCMLDGVFTPCEWISRLYNVGGLATESLVMDQKVVKKPDGGFAVVPVLRFERNDIVPLGLGLAVAGFPFVRGDGEGLDIEERLVNIGAENAAPAPQRETCDPHFFEESRNYTIKGDTNRTLTGADLNFAARVIFAESSSITSGLGDQINRERDAIASVLYNRIGRTGFPDNTARHTFRDVSEAPNAFEAVTGSLAHTRKFRSSDITSGAYRALSEMRVNSRGQLYGGDCNDLRGSVDAIRRLVNYGSQYGYTQFRAGTRGPGTVIGGSRFF